MSEKINVLIGANIEGLKTALAESGKSLSDFGEIAQQAPKRAKTAVDQLNQSYRDAVRDAKNLALTQGQTSEAFYEAQVRVKNLKNEIQGLNTVVGQNFQGGQDIEATSQKFNMLGHSMNQITRELPAFTYSMQTGFMAISNNIPILVDQINDIKKANAGLVKSGQPVQSVFTQLATSLFSWQTGLSVGITLLTMFGAKLFSSSQDASKLAEATDKAAESQKRLNDLRDKYLLTELQRELKQEQKDFEELKTLLNNKLKAYDVYAYQLSLKGKQLSTAEFFDRMSIQDELEAAEISHNNNISQIKQAAAEAQLRIQEKAESERLKKIDEQYKFEKNAIKETNEYAEKFEIKPKQFKFEMPEIPKIKPITFFLNTKDAMSGLDRFIWEFSTRLDEVEQKVGKWSEVMAGLLTSAAVGFGEELIEKDKFKGYGESILRLLGDLAIQIGSAIIALGTGMLFGPTFALGMSYIIGGTGLVTLGSAMKANNAPSPKKPNTGGGDNQSSSMGGGANIPSFNATGMMISIDGLVRGNNIVVALDNQTRMNRRVR
jgi:hypothetical protein